MVLKTFSARITGGLLQFDEPLSDLEDQPVKVTIAATALTPFRNVADSLLPAAPDWPEVEHDVYLRMPLSTELLEHPRVVEGEPLRPTVRF